MTWGALFAPALGLVGVMIGAWVTAGSVRARRQKSITADLAILEKLPDDHAQRDAYWARVDEDIKAHTAPRRHTGSWSNQWGVVGVGAVVLAVGVFTYAMLDSVSLGALLIGGGIGLIIRACQDLLNE